MPAKRLPDTMTLTDHLDELRSRVIRAVLYLAAGMTATWFLYWQIIAFLSYPVTGEITAAGSFLRPIGDFWRAIGTDPGAKLAAGIASKMQVLRMLDAFWLRMQVSFISGICIAMPFILWELWRFIAPGLTPRERRVIRTLPLSVFFLFLLGAAFGYAMTPWFVDWLTGRYFVDPKIMETRFTPEGSILWIAKLLLAFGLGFQLPILVIILNRVGILPLSVLNRRWREATFIIFAIAAIITPTWDPISMCIAALPLALLYLATLGVITLMERRDRKTARADSEG